MDDDGCLEFLVEGGRPAVVVQKVPVEAEASDKDGIGIHCLLFVTKGVLAKLEFYKDDNTVIEELPNPDAWEVVVLPPPPPGLG